MNLSGKRALVCGASLGIGRACAESLAKAGAQVTALARNESKLKSLMASFDNTQKHSYIVADVGQRSELKRQIEECLREGPFDILICNTGGPKAGPIEEAKEEDFLAGFEKHVLVNSLLAQKLLPGMKEKGYGRIINITSTSVRCPLPNLGVSNSIRAAVASWAKTLAGEVGRFGITVNTVLPGFTDTERLRELMIFTAEKQGKTLLEVEKDWKETIPLKRFAVPAEIASVITFLASPSASYVNGITIPVDGGRLPVI